LLFEIPIIFSTKKEGCSFIYQGCLQGKKGVDTNKTNKKVKQKMKENLRG